MASPLFQNGRLLVLARAKFRLDPRVEFFGIGNNDIGPDYVSTHAMEEIGGALTVGWRPFERLAFNFGLGVRRVDVWCDCVNNPCTVGLYPDLPGVGGGMVNYLNLSLVWNNRDAVVRPTRGWRVIFKVVHTNEAILSDYTFTRLALDSGYLRSFFDDSLVIGLRFNGEWVTGPERDIPFWELTSLGGDDTLRGFYPNRFLGKGRLLINGEARFLLTDFVFVKLWRIRIDGVVFGDGGRVFINKDDLDEEFSLDTELIGRVLSGLQYSYGCGLRFAIARSLVARIDAGFSNEETGLIYLSFGQTF